MVELVRELASHFGDTPAGWVSDRASFDDRVLDALFEMNRGNLRATDDIAFKSLDYAAAGGSWPHACEQLCQRAHLHSRGGCDAGAAWAGLGAATTISNIHAHASTTR
ncbi:MAG TPA: hypothetical protein VNJ06_10415, partial [Gemmatimonadales bacterium]|nr:hypothetical protein [Gemmatimonadales bacterium]